MSKQNKEKSKNLSNKILEKIKKGEIKPKSKWFFLSKNFLIWFLSFLSLILSSVIFSVIIYFFKSNDWELRHYISSNIFKFLIITLPYFWIIFLSIAIATFYYLFRQTKKGYKYSLLILIILSFVISLSFGFGMHYNFNLGGKIESLFIKKDFYRRLNHRHKMWDTPPQGRIGVIILEIEDANNFFIEDFRSQDKWRIISSAETKQIGNLEVYKEVKVIGKNLDSQIFEAELIKVAPHDFFRKSLRTGQEGFAPHKRGERKKIQKRIRE